MGGEAVSVRVVCRIRPINKNEEKKGEKSVVIFKGENGVTTEAHSKKCFNFDAVLQPEVTQEEVFEEGMRPIIEHVLKGYNATVFAYGQTASGKTFTMEGALSDEKGKGVIPRMVEALFKCVEGNNDAKLTIHLSYFEIYNEKLQDLLKPESDNLPVHEKNGAPYVKGLHEEALKTPKEVMKWIEKGKKSRHIGKTNMNEHSSRSHSVVQLKVEQSTMKGKSSSLLFLVDLAGSEKVAKTGATGQTLNEAKNINKSLSCLGNVINALTDKKKAHVPYRDSKLTRILQESLGGNARTTMVICCSPAKMNEAETQSTLMFGQRVKTIKNNVKANTEKSSEYWMKMYNNECNKGAKIKVLVLKLIKEAKEHRKGGKPKPEVDLDELKKLLEDFGKGDADAKIEKMGDDGGGGGANVSADVSGGGKDKEEKKSKKESGGNKESKTSSKAGKESKGGKEGKEGKERKKSKVSGIEEEGEGADASNSMAGGESGGEGGGGGGGGGAVPEDVKAVLEQEVKLKTEEFETERGKLIKQMDAKDDKIAQLTQDLNTLKAQMEEHGNKYKSSQAEGRKAAEQLTNMNRTIDQFKERNKRLEQESKQFQGEIENAKTVVKQKEEESRSKDKEIQDSKQQVEQMKQEVESVKTKMQNLSTKYGQQLCTLAEDISVVGKNFVGERNAAQFEYRKPDAARPNEGFAASRALLAKAKHYAVGGGRKYREMEEEIRRLRNDKEQREGAHVEQMMMLNQAKNEMDNLKDKIQDLKDDNQRLQNNIQKRNAQIAAMGKSGADEIDDPDLKMLNDEHQAQIQKLRAQMNDEIKKGERAQRERDDTLQLVERLKSEMQAQKQKFAREKAELEAGQAALMGYDQEVKAFQKSTQNAS